MDGILTPRCKPPTAGQILPQQPADRDFESISSQSVAVRNTDRFGHGAGPDAVDFDHWLQATA
jgi:hypothetical protein